MKFWKVKFFNRAKDKLDSIIVESSNTRVEIIKIIAEIYPHYEKITIKPCKKPKGVKAWKS